MFVASESFWNASIKQLSILTVFHGYINSMRDVDIAIQLKLVYISYLLASHVRKVPIYWVLVTVVTRNLPHNLNVRPKLEKLSSKV